MCAERRGSNNGFPQSIGRREEGRKRGSKGRGRTRGEREQGGESSYSTTPLYLFCMLWQMMEY